MASKFRLVWSSCRSRAQYCPRCNWNWWGNCICRRTCIDVARSMKLPFISSSFKLFPIWIFKIAQFCWAIVNRIELFVNLVKHLCAVEMFRVAVVPVWVRFESLIFRSNVHGVIRSFVIIQLRSVVRHIQSLISTWDLAGHKMLDCRTDLSTLRSAKTSVGSTLALRCCCSAITTRTCCRDGRIGGMKLLSRKFACSLNFCRDWLRVYPIRKLVRHLSGNQSWNQYQNGRGKKHELSKHKFVP